MSSEALQSAARLGSPQETCGLKGSHTLPPPGKLPCPWFGVQSTSLQGLRGGVGIRHYLLTVLGHQGLRAQRTFLAYTAAAHISAVDIVNGLASKSWHHNLSPWDQRPVPAHIPEPQMAYQ